MAMNRLTIQLFFLAASLFAPSVVLAQSAETKTPERNLDDAIVPFDEWVAEGKRDVPAKVTLLPATLGFDQRLEMLFFVEVAAKKLAKLGDIHHLYLLARVGDERGVPIEGGMLTRRISKPLPKNATLQFRMSFFVIPGKYTLSLLLYDRTTRKYSAYHEKVDVKPIKGDPLPRAFSSLPRVQVIPHQEGMDNFLLPRIYSRLALPVETPRPVHFEVVMVLGPMEQQSLRSTWSYSPFGFALSALHVFAQLRPRDFTFHVTVVDPLRRNILLEQKDGSKIDWAGLKQSVAALNPGTISAQALEGQQQNAAYLREVITGRLTEALPANATGETPLRVVMLIGSPIDFPRGSDRKPIEIGRVNDFLFYQFRYTPFYLRGMRFGFAGRFFATNFSLNDELGKVLKPVDPVLFDVENPWQLREAIARLIREIEAHEPRRTVAGAGPAL